MTFRPKYIAFGSPHTMPPAVHETAVSANRSYAIETHRLPTGAPMPDILLCQQTIPTGDKHGT